MMACQTVPWSLPHSLALVYLTFIPASSESVEMAFALLPSVLSGMSSHFQVLVEHFDDPLQLQEAIHCSEECATLLENSTSNRLAHLSGIELRSDCISNDHSTHQGTDIVAVTDEEMLKLGEAANHVMIILEETKQAVSVVREMKQRVKSRKELNIERARDVFNSLQKVIDEREELIITDINRGAEKKENALKVSCQQCSCC